MTIWRPRLDPSGPSYLAISRALEADIRSGRLPDGTRLPTHRALARALGVNVGTVSRAYAEARRRGLVSGEVGRGSFVRRPGGPPLAPRRGSPALIDLGANVPLAEPAPDLAAALRALAERADLGDLVGYGDPAGGARARAAGAAWLARLGVETTPERVIVCAGSQHAILVALATLAGPGETVLAEALTYPGFLAAAKLLGLRVRPVRIDEDGVVPESLEAACAERPRLLYCMPDLQNPTTACMPEARRREIAAIARRHDLALVVDDVTGRMIEGAAPALASLAPDQTLTIGGVSKLLVPSLRTSFVAVPQRHAARMAEVVWASTWMAPALGAELAAEWIESGAIDAIAAGRRRELALRGDLGRRLLGALRVHTRPGASHLWAELPAQRDPAAFAGAALDRGVVVVPSDTFAVAPAPPPPAVRISLSAAPDLESLRRGLEIVAGLAAGEPPAPFAVRL